MRDGDLGRAVGQDQLHKPRIAEGILAYLELARAAGSKGDRRKLLRVVKGMDADAGKRGRQPYIFKSHGACNTRIAPLGFRCFREGIITNYSGTLGEVDLLQRRAAGKHAIVCITCIAAAAILTHFAVFEHERRNAVLFKHDVNQLLAAIECRLTDLRNGVRNKDGLQRGLREHPLGDTRKPCGKHYAFERRHPGKDFLTESERFADKVTEHDIFYRSGLRV